MSKKKRKLESRRNTTSTPSESGDSTPLDRWLVYLAACTCGAAIMILEVLGSRVLSPVFGTSLFVWSSIISVTLLSLAVGYYIGGRVADRKEPFLLFAALGWTAILVAAIPVLIRIVLPMTDSLGTRAGSLVSSFLLFCVPLALLAAATPIGIKLASTEFETVGVVAGVISAVGTLGGVSATLLTGFLLLPAFGTRALLFGVSVSLAFISTIIIVRIRPSKRILLRWTIALWAVVTVLIFLSHVATRPSYGFRVLKSRTTLNGKVQVVEEISRSLRWLLVDASAISVKNTTRNQTILPYLAILESLPYFRPKGNTALVVGLGSGHIVGRFFARGITTDAIEINSDIVQAARDFFDLHPPRKMLIGDARREIRELVRKGESYDFILHDCFTGGSMPAHLLTVEALQEVDALLTSEGVLALSFFGGANDVAVASVGRTLQSVFPFLRVFVPAHDKELIDHVFLASRSELALPPATAGLNESPEVARTIYNMRQLEYPIDFDHGTLLTNDRNPLELMQAGNAEQYRQKLIDRLGLALFVE